MENTVTWLLIADSSNARIYSTHKARLFQSPNKNALHLLHEFSHADSRKKISELTSDKMGEFGSGSFAETTNPKEHEAEEFAHELLLHLENNRKVNSYQDLIIVAPPSFMGILNKHMPRHIKKMITQTIEKDYVHLEENQLLQSLSNHL